MSEKTYTSIRRCKHCRMVQRVNITCTDAGIRMACLSCDGVSLFDYIR